ncbi:PREDICTED: basic 7S globulin-like [Nelumbo nucifera]|uniref:Basic 7S globulin-like n=1 Tax=Nelumbo nucifera TaxID=4432 RepID=A0A1U8BMN3_NELNU|nr:PREDICTED: basic 7S globulin-like [Nelumbo nucifera]
MAILRLLLLFLFFFSLSEASTPATLFLPITKDGATHQYVTRIYQGTPLTPFPLVLDLAGQFLWVDCDSGYSSSSYRSVRCRSIQCAAANAQRCGLCFSTPRPGCNNHTCGLSPENTVTGTVTSGELAVDVIALPSAYGSEPGPIATAHHFLFSCAPTPLLAHLASGVRGMAGFGRNRIGLPSQLAAAFNFDRKFAICLPSSTASDGVVFFGNGPYTVVSGIDLLETLQYTPVIVNPLLPDDYFIGVESIKISGKKLSLNASLLSIDDREGTGGTKLGTVVPYSTMESSIYAIFTKAFERAAIAAFNMTRVASVGPFGVCFSSESVDITRTGPSVPTIDLVLQSEMVYWRISGANSMVQVSEDVMCLGFLDGGPNARTSIVVGGFQLENNLVLLDVGASRLGFSSSLLTRQMTCSDFNLRPIRRVSS